LEKSNGACLTVFSGLSALMGMAPLAMVAGLLASTASYGKTDVPVFLLSGQSNMAGADALVSELTPDQKKDRRQRDDLHGRRR
jgi:hypothetical protein